jgi:hypothetical protein
MANIDSLDDVTITSPTENQALLYQSGVWVNANIPLPTGLSLSGLSDVDNLTPAIKHVLFYNSDTNIWQSKQLNYNDLSSLPALKSIATSGIYTDITGAPFTPNGMQVTLNDLSNVTAPTPTNGQYLKWVTASSSWVPSTIPTVVTSLSGLTTDVLITSPTDNQLLKYNTATSKWINQTITYTLDDLTDVGLDGPTTAQFLKFNGTFWENNVVSYSDVSGTPTIPDTLGSLTDVTDTSFTINDTIIWDGAEWVSKSLTDVQAGKILKDDCSVDVSVNDDVSIQGGSTSGTGGNIILTANNTTNVDASIILQSASTRTTNTITSNDVINITSIAGVKIQDIQYPTIDGDAGDVMVTDGVGNITFTPVPLPTAYMVNFKDGLTLSKTDDAELTVNVGICRDSTNAYSMIFGSPFVKNLSTWVEGSGNGCVPAAILPIVINRFYYVFSICKSTGEVDVGIDTSISATNLINETGDFDYYRLIGIIWTDSAGHISSFKQIGNDFILSVPKKVYTYVGSPVINPLIDISVNLPVAEHDIVVNFTVATPFVANDVYVTIAANDSIPATANVDNNVYFGYGNIVRHCFKHTVDDDMSFKMTSNSALATLSVNLVKFTIN